VSEAFYDVIRFVGRHVFWLTSRPLVLHAERLRRAGAFIVAANHQSPYDVPLLIRHAGRHLDFVSITEVFRNPFVAWFYGSMNAFPLDRARRDSLAVRTIIERLKKGRAIAMFPEGRLTPLKDSVVSGGRIRPGIGRIAQMTGAPVIPVAIVDSRVYGRVSAWLPIRRMRYGMLVGEPLVARADLDKAKSARVLEEELKTALVRLYAELSAAMGRLGSP
jgi:1-acyl-sn-glycerol-3-phosphate acyltransferase